MAEVFDLKNYKIVNQVNGIALAQYLETANTVKGEVSASGFFNKIAEQLGVGSTIICSLKDGVTILAVAGNTAGVVTTAVVATSVS